MERTPVVSQYHQLRDYLNRPNKLANQNMEVEFKIEEIATFHYRFYAILKNESESHRIALAERGRNKTWERAGFTPFEQFEEFCASELNRRQQRYGKNQNSLQIASERIFILEHAVSDKVKMLLLNAGYEP